MGRLASVGVGVVVASLTMVGCGSSSKSSTGVKATQPATSAPSTTAHAAPGTGAKLVAPAKLKGALLTGRDAGSGWVLVSSGSGSGTQQPGPSTTKPAKSGNGSPSLASVKAPKQCKALVANFDVTSPVANTAAGALFRKADTTVLTQTLVSSTATKKKPAADRAALSACKSIFVSTGLAREEIAIAPFTIPRLGDESVGVKLTVTVKGQGKTVVQKAYLAEILRGNTLDAIVLADGATAAGVVKPTDPGALGPLARRADAKVASIT